MIKKHLPILIVLSLIFLALALNYLLQIDFFSYTYGHIIAIIYIIVLDSSKLITELLYFHLSINKLAKCLVGVLGLILVSLSFFSSFSIRVHKSLNSNFAVESKKDLVKRVDGSIEHKKAMYKREISSIDDQIRLKQGLIKSLRKNSKTNKYLKYRYNQEIDNKIKEKKGYLDKLARVYDEDISEKRNDKDKPVKLSFHESLSKAFKTDPLIIDLLINGCSAIVIELIIIFLSYLLIYTVKQWSKEKAEIEKLPQAKEEIQEIEQEIESLPIGNNKGNGLNIKEMREEKGLTQQELADIMKVSVRTIRNYESDSKKIPNEQLSKIRELQSNSIS